MLIYDNEKYQYFKMILTIQQYIIYIDPMVCYVCDMVLLFRHGIGDVIVTPDGAPIDWCVIWLSSVITQISETSFHSKVGVKYLSLEITYNAVAIHMRGNCRDLIACSHIARETQTDW